MKQYHTQKVVLFLSKSKPDESESASRVVVGGLRFANNGANLPFA